MFFSRILEQSQYLWSENGLKGFLKSTLFSSTCLLTSCVSGAITYYLVIKCLSTKKIDVSTLELPYEQRYLTELKELKERKLTKSELTQLCNKTICEETPEGNVIMFYNNNTESYWYYTDVRNISYKILDAVARCYAVTYDVKMICVNYKDVWDKAKATAIAQQKKDKEMENISHQVDNPINKVDSVFAQFKDYNRKTHSHPSIKRRRYKITTDESNQFTFKGKLSDYDSIQNQANKKSEKRVSFSEFKKMNTK